MNDFFQRLKQRKLVQWAIARRFCGAGRLGKTALAAMGRRSGMFVQNMWFFVFYTLGS